MNLSLSIEPSLEDSKFINSLTSGFAYIAPAIQNDMAQKFYDMVLGNFGTTGVDRPVQWPVLKLIYSKKVKRQMATLYVSGRLKNSVKLEDNKVSISDSDVPYALVHQFGGGNNIPARPYFPIDENGKIMPFTLSETIKAGQESLNRNVK